MNENDEVTVVILDDDDLDMDDDDDLWFQAESELAEERFAEALAGIDPATLTRRDIRELKELLRDHPAVTGLLVDNEIGYVSDSAADIALQAMIESWGIPVPREGRKALSRLHQSPETASLGKCLWPGCDLPPKERTGSRGRIPKRCHVHTIKHKRQQDRDRLAAKRAGQVQARECCQEWLRSGHRGPCRQHRDYEMTSRPPYPLTAIEAAYLGQGCVHLV